MGDRTCFLLEGRILFSVQHEHLVVGFRVRFERLGPATFCSVFGSVSVACAWAAGSRVPSWRGP